MALDPALQQKIIDMLKDKGLDVAEEAIADAVNAVLDVIVMLAPELPTGVGVVVEPIVDIIRPAILAIIDQIDGEDDPGR